MSSLRIILHFLKLSRDENNFLSDVWWNVTSSLREYVMIHLRRVLYTWLLIDVCTPVGYSQHNLIFFLYLGDFKFDKIGSQYNASVPVFAMRAVPAVTGSLLIPLVYMIMLQLNYSQWTAALAGFLFLFGILLLLTLNWIIYLFIYFINR